MKQTTSLAHILAATLPGIALVLLIAGCDKKPEPAKEAESAARCPECQVYVAAVSTLERTCLSGQSAEASAKISGTLDILKKAASGVASLSEETIRGARNDWDATIGREENRDIRECLKPVQEKLLTCLDRCVANTQASVFPPELNLQLRLTSTAPMSPAFLNDHIVLGMKSPPRARPSKRIEIDSDGWFHDDVATPAEGGQLEALIHRAVKEGYATTADPKTKLCLTRAPTPPPPFSSAIVQVRCPEGGACRDFDELDPGWLALCDDSQLSPTASLFPRQRAAEFSFISSAQAQAPEFIWVVPSIESLAARRNSLHDGYTAFSIDAADLGSMDANGVSLHLRVNDVEVQVEGMPGEFLTKIFDPGKPLHLEFGLENLDFEGRNAGCDSVSAELRFWKGTTQVGKSIVLERSYAALRDGETITQTVDGYQISWSGHYEPPLTPVDWRVFVQSILLESWDALNDPAKVRRRVDKLEATRSALNGLGLVYGGRPVVAVMRPPLTKPSWGLALGLRQETGQIRFTFTQEEAGQFLDFLRAQRSDQNPQASRLIRDDSNRYIERHNVARPSNCLG